MIRISEVILRERTKKKLTQQQLANFLNVTKATISKWENGASFPDITLLPLLAAFFNLTVDELLDANRVMTTEEIRKWYKEFAQRFSSEPFHLVLEDVQQYKKLYYDDENFLLQIAILLLNHAEISSNHVEVLTIAQEILERIEEFTDDVWIRRQANVLSATIALYSGKPIKALDRLEHSVRPILGEELLLSQTYEALGERHKAKEVLQVTMYQLLVSIIGVGTSYMKSAFEDKELFFETIKRIESIIEAFEVDHLHPNLSLQFYYTVAYLSAEKQDDLLCKKYLTKYTDLIATKLFPFQLRGDNYFNLLDDWFETLDLGVNPLREENVIIDSILQSFEHVAFKKYEKEKWFIHLQEKIKILMERLL